MKPAVLAPKLAFVVTQRGLDEATILALAVSKGIQLLYQEAVTEAYLLGQLSHEQALTELGPNTLADLEYQREALKRDVEWGLTDD